MAFLIGDLEEDLRRRMTGFGGDLKAAIGDFQSEYGLRSREVSAATSMLAKLNVRRDEVYRALLNVLRDNLVSETANKPPDEMKQLFEDVFDDLIENQDLRALPLAILDRADVVDYKYLRALAKGAPNSKTYADLSLSLKQEIWSIEGDLFKQELMPYIVRLSRDPELAGMITRHTLSDITPKRDATRRADNFDLRTICYRIGANEKLVSSALKIVRHRFIETGSTAFCSLSLDVILRMSEDETGSDLSKVLEDSFEDMFMFAKRLGNLEEATIQNEISSLKDFAELVAMERIETIAVLLGAVTPVHAISSFIIKTLVDKKAANGLGPLQAPFKADKAIMDASYLLLMGLEARRIILEKSFSMDERAVEIQLAMLYQLISEDYDRDQLADDADIPSYEVHRTAKDSPLFQRLLTTYALHLFKVKDAIGICRLRRPLEYTFVAAGPDTRERYYSEFFLHLINMDTSEPVEARMSAMFEAY
mmetsp:Transcript_8440/g.25365  ORF Transcript_8440/g.25365 Transcript_8440/m.25365 type:complete len:479 (+) Transcript_8440:68-1504(+)|eukprot:CAMPEP_0198729446 /NCGR_PEP_ID=MMETSP1475-20131203/18300_1 /TAXON_ID= ORGANISM="Unidentified sp., Strain CCMP1999" /NCGR_SAMPLE_ID=MMETSP1475 /ASSEMBLY_ACC=CAM_ASM_001111 /LENGTH=478 /DNA_ID=CAMNT_0044492095 /DNA_START=46 /DNA_END=1482 /DNA_ORIENTATION=-